MTWTYEQSSGRMSNDAGEVVGVGYSGGDCGRHPEGKNSPQHQSIPDVGPLPCGLYRIGAPVDTISHGPYVLPLSPNAANEMFGRSGFLIHGDSVVHPGNASEGCIILSRDVRNLIGASIDHDLQVVPGPFQYPDVDGEISV